MRTVRGVGSLSAVRESRPAGALRTARERLRLTEWPVPVEPPPSPGRPSVAIVVVNHNTRALIARLAFSLHRILGRDQFDRLVVVDNASRDGSAELLGALHGAGLITLIANPRQRYHGSGLNQAVSWLARRARTGERTDVVWALDSDTLVLRRDAVADATAHMRSTGAAIVGQPFGEREGHGPLALCSLMFDPARTWRRPVAPFGDDGAPERRLLTAAARAGLPAEPFPFLSHSYVLHLGSGTLRAVASGEPANRFYPWARGHAELTYTDHAHGPAIEAELDRAFSVDASDSDPASVVEACRRDDLLALAPQLLGPPHP